MQEILAWILLNKLLSAFIVAGLFLVLLIALYIFNKSFQNAFNFWWLNFKTDFPVFGTIAKISTDDAAIKPDTKWRSCEEILCGKYLNSYDKETHDTEYYNICRSYLRKIGEQGRKPTPFFVYILILSLVVAEALGFAYVLAGYTIPGASESLQQKGAIGIAFVISAILVFLTHSTGAEIYKNSILGRILQNRNEELTKTEIDLNAKKGKDGYNGIDDDEPPYQQAYNRFAGGDRKSWLISIVTAVFIVIVAIGATYVRGQVLEKQLIQEISTTSTNIYDTAPTELGEIQSQADAKALKEQQDADRKGGWATFIVLGVLFVFIQILGIIFGNKWGFAGKQSYDAYLASYKFKTEIEYKNYMAQKRRAITARANEKLNKIKRKINAMARKYVNFKVDTANDPYRTFENFIAESREKEAQQALREENTKRNFAYSNAQEKNKYEADLASIKQNTQKAAQNDIEAQNSNSISKEFNPNSDEIKELEKRINRLQRKLESFLEEGVKKSSDEYLDVEDEKKELEKRLQELLNA